MNMKQLEDIYLTNMQVLRICGLTTLVKYKKRLAKSAESIGLVRLENCELMEVYKVNLNDNLEISKIGRKLIAQAIDVMLLKDWISMGYDGALIFCFSNNCSFLITSTRGEDNINIENL